MTSYRSPSLTVDIVIEHAGGIVLIERRNPPLGFALPGGFVDYGETVEAAAVREAREETGLAVTLDGLIGVYSDPQRDARQHTVSVVFRARGAGELRAGDDAKHAFIAPIDALPAPLCFDHARILADYAALRRAGPPSGVLHDSDRTAISSIAWQALATAVALPISSVRPALRGGPLAEPGACTVTLRSRKSGTTRGSAGGPELKPVLATAIEEATLDAASAAQPPIRRGDLSDLQIEVALLTITHATVIATDD